MAKAKLDATEDTRTCPECGAKVARSILLCDCGYHFQTRRVLDETEARATDDASLAANAAALRGDDFEPPPRRWLLRSAMLLQLLAGLSVAGTLVWIALLLTALMKSGDASTSSAQADATSTLVTLLLVMLGGVVNFVLLMGSSEAATALRDLERHALALRRTSRPG